MACQLRTEIKGGNVDYHFYQITLETGKPDPFWSMWDRIASPHRPKPGRPPHSTRKDEDSESVSVGGGGMAASSSRQFIITPSPDKAPEIAKIEELIRRLRAERTHQVGIMDRAMHDVEYRERIPFEERRVETFRAVERAKEITSIIRSLAIYTPSDRSKTMLFRARRFMKSAVEITFQPLPEPVEN